MENDLFRKESVDHISSPEELHDYMRVTSPRLWMILAAIIVLLAGFVVYASMTTMENTLDIRMTVESFETQVTVDGEVQSMRSQAYYAALPLSMKDTVSTGMPVRLGNARGQVSVMSVVNDDDDPEHALRLVFDMENDPDFSLPDGEYDAKLVLESRSPISFLWN